MKIYIMGVTYIVEPEMQIIAGKLNSLLSNDNTHIVYISEQGTPSDDDTILVFNIENKIAFPVLLHIFNDMVREYMIPVMHTFPRNAIINSKATDFVICPDCNDSKFNSAGNYKYNSSGNTLFLSVSGISEFSSFGTEIPRSATKPKEKYHAIEMTVHEMNPQVGNQLPRKKVSVSPQSNKIQTPKNHDKNNTMSIRKPVVDNIKQFCKIDSNSFFMILCENEQVISINKRTGSIVITDMKNMYENNLLDVKNASDIISVLHPCPIIPKKVSDIALLDIRHAIRLYESKKDSVVTKNLFAISNGILNISPIPKKHVDEHLSIKNCSIAMHRAAKENYERVKAALNAYQGNVFLIVCKSGAFIVTSESPKKNKMLPIGALIDKFDEIECIEDMMAMFPNEHIVCGDAIGVSSIEDVDAVSPVSNQAIQLCSRRKTVKNRTYAYDPASKSILFADLI